jgi:hypothetical protein
VKDLVQPHDAPLPSHPSTTAAPSPAPHASPTPAPPAPAPVPQPPSPAPPPSPTRPPAASRPFSDSAVPPDSKPTSLLTRSDALCSKNLRVLSALRVLCVTHPRGPKDNKKTHSASRRWAGTQCLAKPNSVEELLRNGRTRPAHGNTNRRSGTPRAGAKKPVTGHVDVRSLHLKIVLSRRAS